MTYSFVMLGRNDLMTGSKTCDVNRGTSRSLHLISPSSSDITWKYSSSGSTHDLLSESLSRMFSMFGISP